MTKAAICVPCSDIFSPRRDWRTDRSWTWCQCEATAVRWRDGGQGQLEVTSLHGPQDVRVLGLANNFLLAGITGGRRTGDAWRLLHSEMTGTIDSHYLFHKERRGCWALIVAVGESSDVRFTSFSEAIRETQSADDGQGVHVQEAEDPAHRP